MKPSALKNLEDDVNFLKDQLSRKEFELFRMRMKIITKFLIEKEIDIDICGIEIGSWECKDSPIEMCFYDSMEDPALDQCLVCGEPHERK